MAELLKPPATPNEPIWIGEGKSGKWLDFGEAMHDCGLNVDAKMVDIFTNYSATPAPGSKAVINELTGETLGIVSDRYQVIQNEDAFAPIKDLVDSGDGVIIAGGVAGNGMNFMIARTEKHWGISLDDNFSMDIVAINSFNGLFALQIMMVPRRLVCNNEFRGLIRKRGYDVMWRIGHTSRAMVRLHSVLNGFVSMIAVQEYIDLVLDSCTTHINKQLPEANAMDLVLANLFKADKDGLTEKQQTIRESKARDFMDIYYNSPKNADYVGTEFGLLNAYADYLTHAPAIPGRRFGNVFDGDGPRLLSVLNR